MMWPLKFIEESREAAASSYWNNNSCLTQERARIEALVPSWREAFAVACEKARAPHNRSTISTRFAAPSLFVRRPGAGGKENMPPVEIVPRWLVGARKRRPDITARRNNVMSYGERPCRPFLNMKRRRNASRIGLIFLGTRAADLCP